VEAPRKSCQLSTGEAMDALLSKRGALNWMLFEPQNFDLVNAGNGGIDELIWALDPNKVFFGFLRLAFKSSGEKSAVARLTTSLLTKEVSEKSTDDNKQRFMTKYVFVHWVGEDVPAMKKGRANARLEEAKKYARGKIVLTMTKHAEIKEDLDLATIIKEMQRLTVVEGEAGSQGKITVEDYLEALAEEQEMVAREAAEEAEAADAAEAARVAEAAEAARVEAEAVAAAVVVEEEKPAEPEPEVIAEIVVEEMEPEKVPEPVPESESSSEEEEELPTPCEAICEVRNAVGIYDWVLVTPMKILSKPIKERPKQERSDTVF